MIDHETLNFGKEINDAGYYIVYSWESENSLLKELDIRGSRNALPEDFRAVVRYLQQGSCPREDLISRIVTPEEALTAMQEWSADPGKVFRILVEF